MTRPERTLSLLIVAAVFVLFSPTIGHEFLRYDDEIYIYDNPRIRPMTAGNIAWIFTNRYFQSYTPLTLLSHMVDYAIWGRDARGHHLVNVVLHAANAGLLFYVLVLCLRAPGSRWAGGEGTPAPVPVLGAAALGSLVFALHPLRAESVAWVSDRKDLLLALFLLASFLAYARGRLTAPGARVKMWRILAPVFFLLALLSKTTALVFPVVLLLADVWWRRMAPRGRNLAALLGEKWVFLLLAAGGAVAAGAAAGDVRFHYAVEHLSGAERWLLGAASPAFYLLHVLWPARLTPVYLVPETPRLLMLAALTAGMTVLAFLPLLRRRAPGALLVWGLFVLFILPVAAGLAAAVQPLADRYTYVPAVATGFAAAALGLGFWTVRAGRSRRALIIATGSGILLAWAALTIRQTGFWKDSVTLWTYARGVAPETGVMTIVPLGIALYYAGEAEGAVVAAQDAIRLEPRHVEAYYLLGLAHMHRGELQGAAEAFRATLERDSSRHAARINLGNILVRTGRPAEAIPEYRKVLGRRPDHPQALYNLGIAFENLGMPDSAEAVYEASHRAHPGFPDPLINLGVLRQRTGRPLEALAALEEARRLEPGSAAAHFNIGTTLETLGRTGEAAESYRKAIAATPEMLDPYINLAGLLARQGDLQTAQVLYLEASRRIPDAADPHFNLGILALVRGDETDAAVRFEHAAILDTAAPAPVYQLALLHLRRGDSLAARAAMRRAAARGSQEAAAWLRTPGR